MLLLSAAGQAEAGTSAFDSTFGDDGRILGTGFDIASHDVGRSVIALSDGKFLIAGTTSTIAGKGDLLVTRLLADGTIDNSFGQQGSVALDGAGGDDFGYHAIKQADGKILVAGNCQTDKTVSCIFRLTTDGSIDTSFGQQGKFLYTFPDGDGSSRITKLALQADGKIIAVGARELGSGGVNADPFAMRLTTTGVLDSSFAASGLHIPASAGSDWAEAVTVDSVGRIVLAIYSTDNNLVAERLTSAGALDTSFNGSGRAAYDGGNLDYSHAVAVDGNDNVLIGGRIRICGWSGNPCSSGTLPWNAAVVRFTEAGALDTGFAVNGFASLDNLGSEYVTEILPAGDDGIFIGGTGYLGTSATDYFTFVAHLDTDGLALAFGDNLTTINGSTNTAHVAKPGGREIAFLRGLARQTSGEIVYSGSAYNENESSQLGVAKLDNGGTPVSTFQSGGIKTFSVMKDGVIAWRKNLRQDADHQILVGHTGASNLLVTRTDNSGTIDTAFGDNGVILIDTNGNAAELADVVVAADGSITLAYLDSPTSTAPYIEIRRLLANGQPVTTFGNYGTTVISFSASYPLTATSTDGPRNVRVAMQADGYIVVAMSGRSADVPGTFIARLSNTGTELVNSSPTALSGFELHDIVSDETGQIYLAGLLNGDAKLTRLESTTAFNTGFASGGWMTVANNASSVTIKQMALLGGSLYVAGSSDQSGDTIGFVTKASQSGVPAASFGTTGTQQYLFGTDQSEIANVQLRGDGKLLLTGTRFGSSADSDGKLVFLRTLANGTIDSSYGIAGLVTDSGMDASSGSSAVAIAGGRALVAGKCGGEACLLRAATDSGAVTTSAVALDFGVLRVGNTSNAQTLTFTNSGSGPLTLNSVGFTGPFTGSSSTCAAGVLESAASCTVDVRFNPTAGGSQTGTLTFINETGSAVVSLAGFGQLPASTQLSATTLTFGNATVNTSGNTVTLTVSNGGDEVLPVTGISITGDYAQSNTCGNAVNGRGSCTVSVQFLPKSAGTLSGTLTVNTGTGSHAVTLTGTGVAQSTTPPPAGGGGGGGGGSSVFGLLLVLPLLRRRQRG